MTTVLVVEDERRIAEIARDYLEHAGFAVITAADGPDALTRARSDHPDLVVLDLGLPALDGLDVAKALRRGLRTALAGIGAQCLGAPMHMEPRLHTAQAHPLGSGALSGQ